MLAVPVVCCSVQSPTSSLTAMLFLCFRLMRTWRPPSACPLPYRFPATLNLWPWQHPEATPWRRYWRQQSTVTGMTMLRVSSRTTCHVYGTALTDRHRVGPRGGIPLTAVFATQFRPDRHLMSPGRVWHCFIRVSFTPRLIKAIRITDGKGRKTRPIISCFCPRTLSIVAWARRSGLGYTMNSPRPTATNTYIITITTITTYPRIPKTVAR